MTSLCADNAPVNFGGPQLNGSSNVFYRLKRQNQRLLPIGCPAHILHNAAREATDELPFDIESIAFKICSHFKKSTKRCASLQELFEIMEVRLLNFKLIKRIFLGTVFKVASSFSNSMAFYEFIYRKVSSAMGCSVKIFLGLRQAAENAQGFLQFR